MFGKWIGLITLGLAVTVGVYAYAEKFLDWIRFQSIGTRDYIHDRLSRMFIEVPLNTILAVQVALSFGTGFLVFLAMLPTVKAGIFLGSLVAAMGWYLPRPLIDFMYQRRIDKFVLQMIDGLSLMSNGLKSGLSIVQAMSLVTQEMPNPIQQEFNLVLSQNKLGVALEEAFLNLSKRIKSDEVEMFVTSVNILKETGGNLSETFDTIVTTIRERIKVEQRIKSMTTQGFIQGMVVMSVPPVMTLYFYNQDPEYMKPMFTTFVGWVILLVIVMLEGVGFLLIRRIMKIDV